MIDEEYCVLTLTNGLSPRVSNVTEKMQLMELNGKEDLLTSICKRGQAYCKKGKRLNSISLKQKAGRFLSAGMSSLKMLGGRLVNMIRPSVFANWQLLKLGSSHRDWEVWLLPFLVMTFQRDGSQVLERDIPGL